MLTYPQIDPVALAIGPLKIHWYGLMYLAGFVSAWWGIPSEYSPEVRPYEVRNWTMTTFTWKASALCHKPLYLMLTIMLF